MKIGKCFKCGNITKVRKHHYKGYSDKHIDDVVDYCYSCDYIAHNKARKEGKCSIPHETSTLLSKRSCLRRTLKTIHVSQDFITPGIRLCENIGYNLNTGNVTCSTFFESTTETKLLNIEVN